ncbi:MAG: Cna B-type domain-containing protein, partial [Clostridiales bacterium]|nr:Cna B-type domain-containing protein [Clostridiales bacterium]
YSEDVKGSLTVTKTVTGAPASEANKTFEFTVTGPNNYSTTVTLKAGESQTLTDLALGTYTVTENGTAAGGAAQISGYTLAVSGEGDVELTATDKAKTATVTNAYSEDVKGSLTVTKTVTGAPASAFDKEFEFTVTGPNNYSESFKLKNGESKVLIDLALGTYTVTENGTAANGAAQIKGYTLAVSGDGDVTLTASDKDKTSAVTNAYTETNEKTSVSIQKVWDDNNNQNGDRPASLTVTLSNGQSVVLNDSNAWSATVDDLPKYENGSEIVYSWSEEQVQGYRMSSSVKDQNDPSKTIITNTYDASSVQTSATVKKVWDDNNDAAGLRPSSLVVYLLQNGTQIDTCTLNEQNGWTATVNNLAKYDATNAEYVYSWTEETITVTGYALESATVSDTTTTLTNKYTAPVLGSLKIKKALAAGAPTDASSMTYHFTVTGTKGYTTTVDIQGEGEFVLDNLELDTYTITEDTASAAISGYTLSVTNNGATVVINSANQEECVITNTYKKDVQTTPDPTGTNPTGTEPTGTEPTGTKPSGTKPSVESPYSEVQEPSETTPTPTTAPDKKIDSVSIDDKPVSPDDFTEKPDGTVEFSSNTIEGLTLGVHRALIKYNDGTTITIEFEVVSSAGRGRSIVKTGDTAKSNLVPAAAFLSIAVGAVAIVIFRRRRTERDAK